MIKYTHKPYQIVGFIRPGKVVYLRLTKINGLIQVKLASRPTCLPEIMRIQVDRGYGRTPPRQFDRIKSCIATYIQHFPSVQLLRNFFFDLIPFESGKVSEEMIGCGLITCGQMDIMRSKSTRLNSSHVAISYAVFCLKKKTY